MAIPLQITFKGLPQSDAIEADIAKHAEKLERFMDRITRCKVLIEAPHQRHHQGNIFQVKIDVRLPEGEFAATRNPNADHSHEDLHVAIRDAFLAVSRQLDHQHDLKKSHRKGEPDRTRSA